MSEDRPDESDAAPRPVVVAEHSFPGRLELPTHTHRRNLLMLTTRGVIAVETPRNAWIVVPGCAIWIPGDVPHAVRTVGTAEIRSVLIEPDLCTRREPACQVLTVSRLLSDLIEEAAEMPIEYEKDGRDSIVVQLLLAEIERAPLASLAVPFPSDQALASCCQAFFTAPNIKATIAEWADQLGMNRRNFTRSFRKKTGMSFVKWRQQACLVVAIPKLASGQPVTEVAFDLGYDGPGNFSTMFKRVLGVSPSHYQPT